MTTAQRLLTADDLLALPDDGNHHELFRGELVTMPLPGIMQSIVTGNIGFRIGDFIDERGLPYVGGPRSAAYIEQNPDTVRAAIMPSTPGNAFPNHCQTVATSPAWFPSWW